MARRPARPAPLVAPVALAVALLAAPALAQEIPCDPVAGLDDRCEVWVASTTAADKTDAQDFLDPVDLAVDPSGTRVYVTGHFIDAQRGRDFLTLAYDAATGAEVWRARWNGPAGKHDIPAALATDGKLVYVTGSTSSETGSAPVALAYGAGSGSLVWATTVAQPGSGGGRAIALGGGRVHVGGSTWQPDGTRRFFAAALDAGSGGVAWSSSVDVSDEGYPYFGGLTVTQDGERAVITGSRGLVWEQEEGPLGLSIGAGYTSGSVITTAFDRDGELAWTTRIDGPDGWGETAAGIVASGDGSRVSIAGTMWRSFDETDVFVASYDATTGAPVWESAQDRTEGDDREGASKIVAAIGSQGVYVAGGPGDFAVIAYAGSGAVRWATTQGSPVHSERPRDIAVSPDGARVYVTGWAARFITYGGGGWSTCDDQGNCQSGSYSHNESEADYGTVGLDAGTGAVRWTARFNEDTAGTDFDVAHSVAASDSRVFVAGLLTRLMGYGRGLDHERIGTVAYPA